MVTGEARTILLKDRLWDLCMREGAPSLYNLSEVNKEDVGQKLKILITVIDNEKVSTTK